MFEKSVSETVSFGERLASSQVFSDLFRDGMALVEETAAYLDGPGRKESKSLPRAAALTYATESMRLTTRLMQIASWLLLQRAVNEGEISRENARAEKAKVQFSATPSERGGPGYDHLPQKLRDFIEQGDRLFDRVTQLDLLERGKMPEGPSGQVNGIADQFSRLHAAFTRTDKGL